MAVAAPLALAAAPSASATTTTDLAKQVITLVNAERKKVGCAPVRRSARAGHGRPAAQRRHGEVQLLQPHLARRPLARGSGSAPQGYDYGSAENIAAGQTTAKSVIAAWMNSSGHRRNILNCSNKALGVGVARGGSYGIYWTQDFGTR